MQTTLLGIAIAIILALIAALAGPYFIDWDQYRSEFESQASRLAGAKIRIDGPIEARLLPIPVLKLQDIEIESPSGRGPLRARSLDLEFALGALIRGEWRVSKARLDGPEITLGLDAEHRFDWPVHATARNLDAVSIEQLEVSDGHIIFDDAATASHFAIEEFEFRGELRSLSGPAKGEGVFVISGQHYPYRIALSRPGDDGGVRLHLNLDPIDRPLIAEIDTVVFLEHGTPRFEGNLQLARPVGHSPDGLIEPWHLTSRIKADRAAAVFDQLEFQYGPDDRAIKFRGTANLTLDSAPEAGIDLRAAQVNVDRLLALPEPMGRRPLDAVKALADYLAGVPQLPIPVRLGVRIENTMFAGAALQRLNGELKREADSWQLERLEFRAPGAAQVRFNGRAELNPSGFAFAGLTEVDAPDSGALMGWLTDRRDALPSQAGSLHAKGDVKIDGQTIAIEALKLDSDRVQLEGRFAYWRATSSEPARIEAGFNASELDLDRIYALAQSLSGGSGFDWPRAGAISATVGLASIAGLEAKDAQVEARLHSDGLEIERLSVGDLGGAALSVKGRIDPFASSPRGTIAVDMDARALDGVAAVVDKFAPSAAVDFRRRMATFAPAKVHATLSLAPESGQPASPAIAALTVDGSAGTFRANLQAKAGLNGVSIAPDPASWGAAQIAVSARVDAGDAGALIELLGLDPWLAVDRGAAELRLSSNGPLNGDMAIEGKLAAGGLDVSTHGTWRIPGDDGPAADLAVKIASARLRNPRPGSATATLPVTISGRVALSQESAVATDLLGTVDGVDLAGRLKIGWVRPVTIDGDIELGEVNLPATIAAASGVAPQAPAAATVWSAEPFEQGLLRQFAGQLKLTAAHVSLTPMLAAKRVHALARFDQSKLVLHHVEGTLAGGRLEADLGVTRGSDGIITVHSQVAVADADVTEIIRGSPPPLSGRLGFEATLEGGGRSPVAVIGSLNGAGRFKLQGGTIRHLDPTAFEAVIRSVDQGLPIDATRVRDRMEQALAKGAATIPVADGEITIAAGQARVSQLPLKTQGVDVAVAGNLALAENLVDIKLTLSGPERADAARGTRPVVDIVLKGPLSTPMRSVDAREFVNWLALRAVEQQSKRLDALDAGHDLPPPAPSQGATGTTPDRDTFSDIPAIAAPRPIVRSPVAAPQRVRPAMQPTVPAQRPLDIRPPATLQQPPG